MDKEEKKFVIEEASLEELRERLKLAEEVRTKKCGTTPCKECVSDNRRYAGIAHGKPCGEIRATLRAAIAIKEHQQLSAPKVEVTPTGKCSQCEKLDKSSGYCFCLHWHNFTSPDGFCYAFSKADKLELEAKDEYHE